ncbi:hypothetical protein COB87_002825 [Candidatus Wolfebacteria bacterium]|nr:hypothetical protein [Candidatus Wolfebacteria bacterium]
MVFIFSSNIIILAIILAGSDINIKQIEIDVVTIIALIVATIAALVSFLKLMHN